MPAGLDEIGCVGELAALLCAAALLSIARAWSDRVYLRLYWVCSWLCKIQLVVALIFRLKTCITDSRLPAHI